MNIFEEAQKQNIALDETIVKHLSNPDSVIAFGVSGGKDSDTLVLETVEFLQTVGYPGEICLIHSDLGLIEHRASIGQCVKLAEKSRLPLILVQPVRPLLERWEHRWSGITKRFIELERVKMVTPFSGAKNRFCTSESKVAPITRELKNRYAGKFIINAVGLRREESNERAKKPVSQINAKLIAKKNGTRGVDWFPILEYTIEDVWRSHRRHGFAAHEAYAKFGMARVSCSFCVLASKRDLRNSLRDERNHAALRQIVRLETFSGFSFRQNDWLADHAADLLSPTEKEEVARAKELAAQRRFLESTVEKSLFFVRDFPAFQPTLRQAVNLAQFRQNISQLYGLESKYLSGEEVYQRYADLLKLKELKNEKRASRPPHSD